MSNSTRTVVHLQINNKHEYYGSTSSLYDQHTAEELGLTKASLNNYFSKLADGAELIYSHTKDGLTPIEMTKQLNEQGFVTSRGCKFQIVQVQRLIQRYNIVAV